MSSTITYDPQSLRAIHGRKAILHVYACGLSMPDEPDERMANHWRLECCLASAETVWVDPTPGDDQYMNLRITYKQFGYSKHALKPMKMDVARGISLDGLLNIIIEERYDKYRFTENAKGCRFWVQSVIRMLSDQALLKTKQQVEAALAESECIRTAEREMAPPEEQQAPEIGDFYER